METVTAEYGQGGWRGRGSTGRKQHDLGYLGLKRSLRVGFLVCLSICLNRGEREVEWGEREGERGGEGQGERGRRRQREREGRGREGEEEREGERERERRGREGDRKRQRKRVKERGREREGRRMRGDGSRRVVVHGQHLNMVIEPHCYRPLVGSVPWREYSGSGQSVPGTAGVRQGWSGRGLFVGWLLIVPATC